MTVRILVALMAAWLSLPGIAYSENLRIGLSSSVTSIDPHFHNDSANNSIAQSIFDRLVERTAEGGLEPGLALSWTPINDTTWEFKLRPGVRWHDGEPLTPEDVVFSFQRAPSVPGSTAGYGNYLRNVVETRAVGPDTVHVITNAPAPTLPNELTNVAIVSKHLSETATTDAYNSGAAAVGTGAYRFGAFTIGEEVRLERNDDWWGNKPDYSSVTYRMLTGSSARVAAILSGDVDIIDAPPPVDLPRLSADARLSVKKAEALRIIYLYLNVEREDGGAYILGPNGERLAANPLRDLRVRQALTESIDREAIVSRLLLGNATPSMQILPAGTFSYAPSLKVVPPDPERAKALLAEAGFPNGFQITIHTTNDRYPNDSAVVQAIAQMWTRIGVKTRVDAIPSSSFAGRSANMEFAVGLLGIGNSTFDATAFMTNGLVKGSTWNRGGYHNPEVEALLAEAQATFDDAKREAALIRATEAAIADVAFIPLYHQFSAWVMGKGVDYAPRKDERTIAKQIRRAD